MDKFETIIATKLRLKAARMYFCASYPRYKDFLEMNELAHKHPYAHGGSKFCITSKFLGNYNALKLWIYTNTFKKELRRYF